MESLSQIIIDILYMYIKLIYEPVILKRVTHNLIGSEALYMPFHNDNNLCLTNLLTLSSSVSLFLFNKSNNVSLDETFDRTSVFMRVLRLVVR